MGCQGQGGLSGGEEGGRGADRRWGLEPGMDLRLWLWLWRRMRWKVLQVCLWASAHLCRPYIGSPCNTALHFCFSLPATHACYCGNTLFVDCRST